ncbi:hypothetical protein LJR164_001650 [Phenylobacterium sp. LjRoot164]|uniref:hypothetical protein n=1 Tax=unclassified Phenylobacterium TaxID=2640670 RepID=UPI003ECE948A
MKAVPIVLAALLLAACATPKERIRTVQVKVPVPVACAPKLPPAPAYEGDTMDLDDDIFGLVRGLLIEREQRKTTEAELRAALVGCGGHPPDT